MSTFGKPVCISYFEGTESQVLLDVIKTRFEVQSNQIIDISAENGEPVYDLASLPDETTVLISIGKAGQRAGHDGSEEQFVDGPDRYGERNSFQLDRSHGAQPELSTESPSSAVAAELKFQELWRLSFPSMGCISRADLLQIENPMILTDLHARLSSLSCGTTERAGLRRAPRGAGLLGCGPRVRHWHAGAGDSHQEVINQGAVGHALSVLNVM
ncbi:hypothetical protein PINS_up022899 [Pythium insidiosum]|nr:hypothetical protein PINS_up022899 [Pythium insidiosum]